MFELQNLDWFRVLEKIQQSATSERAKEKILQTAPLNSADEAQRSFSEILEATEILKLGHRPFMQTLDLFSTWITRLKKGSLLKTLEIRDVRGFCLEVLALREALSPRDSFWTKEILSQLVDPIEPLSAIDQILSPNGEIRSDASETLYRLHNEKEKLAREVQQNLDRLVKAHDMENLLQEKFVTTREGRWVLPIKSGMQHFLPGVIHAKSQTKQTVYMEPETVIPLNNRLRQIEIEIEDEIERLLTELSKYLSRLSEDFERSSQLMETCDLRFAQAQFSGIVNAAPCDFTENTIELHEVRHPLLLLSGKATVANSVQLGDKKSILLLSGPNAGGKTVLLKAIGLAAQMARCGLLICADDSSKLPFFKNLTVSIGDAQSIGEDLSTFAAHLKTLNEATQLKGPENLILIDEICGSTDPEEGSALARSFIESFASNQALAVVTSHLGPLKAGWGEDSPVLNGSLEYDSKSGKPTYQFLAGVAGDSLALLTAKRVGVKNNVLERAKEILSPASRARIEALEQIESLKHEISSLQENLRKEIQKANAEKKKFEKMNADFEKQKEDWLVKTVRKAEKKVDEAITQAKVDQTFTRHRQLQEIKFQLPEIVKAKSITTGVAETADEFAKKFPPGNKVFISSLNQDGIIQSEPNSKGEVYVLSQSIRLQVPWQDLRPPGQASNPTTHLVRQSSKPNFAILDQQRSLDLRGKIVEDALEELEIALDRAAVQKEDRLKVIHGHGTEALKKAVRTYLSRSVYVKKWKAGTSDQGGDGITWVELNNEV